MTTYPITLHEDEQSKVVQISGEYHPFGAFTEALNELKAVFTTRGTELYRVYGDKNKQFGMSAAEADAFVSAWETFKAERELKKLTEQKRLADVEAEAYQLAENCKALQVEKREDGCLRWDVTLPDFGWHDDSYTVDDLLECVKKAIEYCRPIQEAYQLAKDYPINFRHQKGTPVWWISINNLFGDDAYADTILEVVQRAKDVYIKHQDKLIKSND